MLGTIKVNLSLSSISPLALEEGMDYLCGEVHADDSIDWGVFRCVEGKLRKLRLQGYAGVEYTVNVPDETFCFYEDYLIFKLPEGIICGNTFLAKLPPL